MVADGERGKRHDIEGPDVSGKGTLIKGGIAYLQKQGLRVFDVHPYWKETGDHPPLDLLLDLNPDVIYMSEPSKVGEGARIRDEYLKTPDRNTAGILYPADLIAEAFSLDRYVMQMRFVQGARDAGIDVVSSRNFLSSLIYQVIQAERRGQELDRDYVMQLRGNAVLMADPPSNILVATASAELLKGRRDARKDKQDDAETEDDDFLERQVSGYQDPWVAKFCHNYGIGLTYVELNGTEEDTKRLAEEHFAKLFAERIRRL